MHSGKSVSEKDLIGGRAKIEALSQLYYSIVSHMSTMLLLLNSDHPLLTALASLTTRSTESCRQ
jgi:hypothetical protein